MLLSAMDKGVFGMEWKWKKDRFWDGFKYSVEYFFLGSDISPIESLSTF